LGRRLRGQPAHGLDASLRQRHREPSLKNERMQARFRHAARLIPFIVTGVLGSCSSSQPSSATATNDAGGDGSPAAHPANDSGAPLSNDASSVDGAPDASGGASYTNPVFPRDFPDPFVLRDGSRYIAFSTNTAGKNIGVVTSTDLATWTELPDALPL